MINSVVALLVKFDCSHLLQQVGSISTSFTQEPPIYAELEFKHSDWMLNVKRHLKSDQNVLI